MLNGRWKKILLALGVSLAIGSLAGGCALRKEPLETESETETETESETETETESESETELETEIGYTSQDGSIRITLPDSTWQVTQDADEMRVFSSGSEAMINIVHASGQTAMNSLSLAESEEELNESLSGQYSDEDAYEIMNFEHLSSATLNTYEYVVKYNSTNMWAYAVTYGIVAQNEAYVITGTVTDDNEVLLQAVQQAVESFTVLNNSAFTAMPGSTTTSTNQSESQTQSESNASASAELQSLTEYGTSTTLYASDNVNIRLEPGTDAGILGSLAPGDSVTVTGETSQWFRVNINGNVGYISKAYLVNTQPSTSQTDAQQSETVSDATMQNAEYNSFVDYGTSYTYYTTTDVNLRSAPGTDSSVVNSVGSGTALTVVGETDNWYVAVVNGQRTYISKSYVSTTNPGTGTQTPSETDANTGGDTGSGTDNTDSGTGTDGSTGTGGSTNTGVLSGTVTSSSANTIVIAGDDGNTYSINTSDASISTTDGLYDGLYISANIDYSNTLPNGDLYATSVSGY